MDTYCHLSLYLSKEKRRGGIVDSQAIYVMYPCYCYVTGSEASVSSCKVAIDVKTVPAQTSEITKCHHQKTMKIWAQKD